MDRPISLEARRVDLAIELPFMLGRARVDPAAHEYSLAGTTTRMQPQTLKVLVALHDKIGQVVTRDQLVDRCWDGRIVGEDVINRSISLLRRLAEQNPAFRIDTVPRSGYRLVETGAGDEEAAVSRPRTFVRLPKRTRLAAVGAAVVLLIGATAIVAYERARVTAPDGVLLEPFEVAGNAPLAHTFAAGVSDDMKDSLAEAGVDVIDAESGGPKAAFLLSGSAELAGPDLHLTT